MTSPKTLRDLDAMDSALDLFSDDGGTRAGAKLQGRKREDQSVFMKSSNPMKGRASPNRGKSMTNISKKLKGKPKPEGFGEKISKARKGRPNLHALGIARPEHSKAMQDPTRNKGAQTMRETQTCPHCGKTANIPNYKRWHGDKCKFK